jgi:chromosome partitioning protein
MIVVVAAVKGGVGKTTSSVYLAALGANRRAATIVDADPQAAAAEWVEGAKDERLEKITVVEAPTDRLINKALDRLDNDQVVVIDTPPAHDRLLGKIMLRADVVVIPTRVGGVEGPRVEAVLAMVPEGTPAGLVITSARTFTRDYQDALAAWAEARVSVWGTIPERVAIAAGPVRPLYEEGLEAYKKVWRKVQTAARSGT